MFTEGKDSVKQQFVWWGFKDQLLHVYTCAYMCTMVLSGLQVTETETLVAYQKGSVDKVQVETCVSGEQVEPRSGVKPVSLGWMLFTFAQLVNFYAPTAWTPAIILPVVQRNWNRFFFSSQGESPRKGHRWFSLEHNQHQGQEAGYLHGSHNPLYDTEKKN